MAAQQRITQITDNLNVLSDLIDILKDPKGFAASEKAIRDELALTDAEAQKAEAAKALIAQAGELQNNLDAKTQDITTQVEKLASDRAAFEEYKSIEQSRLEAFSAELDAREANIEVVRASVMTAQKALDEGQKRVADQIQVEQTKIDTQKAAILQDAQQNAVEKENLRTLKTDLDKRAQKITLREQASAL